jgi:hypothetical protein
VLLLASPSIAQDVPVPRFTRFEARFTSSADYRNAVQEASMEVEFTSPSGKKTAVPGFWDSRRTWCVRFSPEEIGRWTWHTYCSRTDDSGLHGRSGAFECVPYVGENPLYRNGPLRVSDNKRYLQHYNGAPFLWLGDTVWNGVLKSDEGSWDIFLADRAAKGFTGVQFVATQWLAGAANGDLRTAYQGLEDISIDPVFYQRMDQRINAINDHGMIAAPVLLWSTGPVGLSPGVTLPDDQLILLARYIVARYGAHQVIWILNGDGNYLGGRADRWKKIGRAVFGDHSNRPVTMHPGGQQWVADEFRNEPWFSFNSYQSGHGGNERAWRWLTEGPPAEDWKKEPHLPSINLEPNYEAHNSFPTLKPFDAHDVRRAAYWSLLVAPPAGVTYGAHGVWSWELTPNLPMNHPTTGVARPWYQAMQLPGSTSMKHLKTLFDSLEWWTLRPALELITDQPGRADPTRFVAAAQSEDKSWAIVYIPVGGSIAVHTGSIKGAALAKWFNPRLGEWCAAEKLTAPDQTFRTPDSDDWILWIGK